MTREAWRERLAAMLAEIQPELGLPVLHDEFALGADLGLDSLAFEELFARLKRELAGPVPMIAWFNELEARGATVGVLLELIERHEAIHVGA